ncbi:MAG: TonB-dependent receptor [Gemmatimonadetes bacterium]|nr:TonB-dependent receptor [Gemmatimonadota bacterium]
MALPFLAGMALAASLTATGTFPGPRVSGTVHDEAGRPLANVQIVVGGINRTTSTNDEGKFVLVGLPAGRHHIDALLLGFSRADASVDVLAAGPDLVLDITMKRATVRLSGVQVTATPLGADPLQISQSTVELSGAELQRQLGATVAQTLASEPGLSMRYNGPAANTPVIRGLSGERVLVLQDGDRAADLSSSSPDHGLSIDPNAAQRIEVVRGPASLLYGTNALGGVVNVITNDIPTAVPQHVEGFGSLQSESATPGEALSFGITTPVGADWAVSMRGGMRNTQDQAIGGGGTLANTFFRNWNGVLSAGYASDNLHAGVAIKHYDFNYGLPAPAGDPESGAQIRGSRQELRFRGDAGLGGGWLAYVRLDGTLQWYAHDEVENTGDVGTSFRLNTQTVNVTAKTRAGRWEGALGLQGLFRQYTSSGAEALTPPVTTTAVGVFAYQKTRLTGGNEPVMLELGARFDLVNVASSTAPAPFGAGQATSVGSASGSIGVSWPLADGVSLGVSLARAFRAPSVEELFSNNVHAAAGSYDIGNRTLQPEVNQGIDAVLRVQRGGIDAQLAAYASAIDNFVVPNFTGDTLLGTAPDTFSVPINRFRQARAGMWGVEGRVESEVRRHLYAVVMADLVRGEFEAGGGFLPFLPPPRAGAGLRWDDGRWMAGGDVRYGHRQWRVTGGNDVATDAFTVVNLQGSYTFTGRGLVQAVALRIDNASDVLYKDSASRVKAFSFNPGRNVSVSYRVLF